MLKILENLFYTLISLYRILKPSNLSLYNGLNKLDIASSSTRIRILGNGNSLNENLDSFSESKVDYMVVNRHVLSDSYTKLMPRFYVLADPHFFNHPEGISVLEEIKSKTVWDMYLFIPKSKSKCNWFEGHPYIKVIFYTNFYYKGFPILKNYFYSHNLALPRTQNVLVAAIYISIALKYKEIELYGVEHSWTKFLFVNEQNEVCLDNPHFFDKEKQKPKTWKEIQHDDARLCDVLRMYAYMFESYHELEEFANRVDAKIINFTEHSFIDAFERAKLC